MGMTAARKVKNFGEFIAYLPYQLGFRPHDAVVLVGWRGQELGLCVHADGPADDAFAASLPAIERGLRSGWHDSVAVVVYADTERPRVLEPLTRTIRRTGLPIRHLAVVAGGRWQVEKCSCGRCPRTWSGVPAAHGVPAVAERILEGAAPLASRTELVERLSMSAPADPVWAGRLRRSRPTQAAALAAWLRGTTTAGTPADTAQLVTAVRSLHDKRWRDTVLSVLAPQEFPALPDIAALEHALTRALDAGGELPGDPELQWAMIASLARIPEPQQAPVLTLIAAAAWAHGGGAVSTIAIGRALEVDPGYRLAQLIGQLVLNGVPSGSARDRLGA